MESPEDIEDRDDSIALGEAEQDETSRSSVSSFIADHVGRRTHIKASADRIFYTYIRQGSGRELTFPGSIARSIIRDIDEEQRDDPEVFEAASNYVFQLLEEDAFPGFLNLGRPLLRVSRHSKSIGSLFNKMTTRSRGH